MERGTTFNLLKVVPLISRITIKKSAFREANALKRGKRKAVNDHLNILAI